MEGEVGEDWLTSVVRENLIAKEVSEQRSLKEVRQWAMWLSGRRSFQAQGRTNKISWEGVCSRSSKEASMTRVRWVSSEVREVAGLDHAGPLWTIIIPLAICLRQKTIRRFWREEWDWFNLSQNVHFDHTDYNWEEAQRKRQGDWLRSKRKKQSNNYGLVGGGRGEMSFKGMCMISSGGLMYNNATITIKK